MKFTNEQEKVIKARGQNLLVSAAAGSGKTAVLVERIFGRITGEDAVDVDRLLVVTFTRAAAAEMKERVRKRLDKAIEGDSFNANLLRQESLLHNAQITTIDAFCNYILRENFTALDIDPQYRIADAGELKLMAEDVLEKTLEKFFEEGDEGFLHCVSYFTAGETMEAFKTYIKELYRTSQSLPDPVSWLTDKPWEKNSFVKLCLEYAARILDEMQARLNRVLPVCEEVDGPAAYAETIEAEAGYYAQALACIDEEAEGTAYDRLKSALAGIEYARLATIRATSGVDPAKKDLVKEARDYTKKKIKELTEGFFKFDYETVTHMDQIAKRASDELCEVVLRYTQALDEAKRDKNIFDFNDIEHLALKALTEKKTDEKGNIIFEPSKTALSYREHFAEVMIDEYQDSNLIQELILNAVSSEGKRFMVGDVKQSIYRFRLARPEIFMEKLATYTDDAAACGRRIDLHQNFRSRSQVLDFSNRIFDKIMAADLGGVDYDADARLVPGREFINEKTDEDRGKNRLYATELIMTQNTQSGDETEARMIANRILELMKTMQVEEEDALTGKKVMRSLRFSDIVILMRATAGHDEVYRRVLEDHGIPVYAESKTGFFEAREVSVMLNLLAVLNNPLQDIPFVCVMHSGIGGFTDAELARIAAWSHIRERAYFSEQVRRFTEEDFEETSDLRPLQDKARAFLDRLQAFRKKALHLSVSELLQLIYDETGYFDNVTAMPNGERRAANLLILLEKAGAYEQTSYRGLHRFIRYIELLRQYKEDEGEANVLDENADVVRIMTIHKSKGLQFPLVFVSNLSGRFNLREYGGKLITDADYGPAPAYIDTEKGFRLSTLRQKIIARMKREAAVGEELRILYVAMTRAEEKLILTATARETLNLQGGLDAPTTDGGVLPYSFRAAALSYKDFICAALEADAPSLQMTESVTREEDTQTAADGTLQIRFLFEAGKEAQKASRHEDKESRKRLLADIGLREPNEQTRKLLTDRFSFAYSHEAYRNLFTKTTVTELKEALHDQQDDVSVRPFERGSRTVDAPLPLFMREDEAAQTPDGAARGVLYHRMMELMGDSLLQKRADVTTKDITAFYSDCEERGLLVTTWRQAVDMQDICLFLRTKLAARMGSAMAAGLLKRESQFMMGVPARELDARLPEEEILLVQGIIDCWFEEDGELVIVDYKTDRVSDEEELITRYKTQLDYYERALEQITGKKVSERILYSFALGKEVKC